MDSVNVDIVEPVTDFLSEHENGLLSIMGPTASGKTGLSIALAQDLEKRCGKTVEIICVDSRQVYRGIDIASTKITETEKQGIIHHGLDLITPEEEYSVVEFQQYAFGLIGNIFQRGNIPMLCGGTMLWLDAITENYEFGAKGEKSDKKNKPKWPSLKIGIHWERDRLYERINKRAEVIFGNAFFAEMVDIFAKYPNITRTARTTMGFNEAQSYLDGLMTQTEALYRYQQASRRYAKRQLTWWRGREDIVWITGTD